MPEFPQDELPIYITPLAIAKTQMVEPPLSIQRLLPVAPVEALRENEPRDWFGFTKVEPRLATHLGIMMPGLACYGITITPEHHSTLISEARENVLNILKANIEGLAVHDGRGQTATISDKTTLYLLKAHYALYTQAIELKPRSVQADNIKTLTGILSQTIKRYEQEGAKATKQHFEGLLAKFEASLDAPSKPGLPGKRF